MPNSRYIKLKGILCLFLMSLMVSLNPVFALEWYNISDLEKSEKVLVEQTKKLKSEYANYPNAYIDVDKGSNFVRYKIFCNAVINKCGLYDEKKDKFTGYKYKYEIIIESGAISGKKYISLKESKNNEIIGNTFSGVPIVIENGERVSVQPFKRVGNSFVRGLYYTVFGIAILPVAIPMGVAWLIIGYEDSTMTTPLRERANDSN